MYFIRYFKDIGICIMVSIYCQPNTSTYVKSVIPESINDEIYFNLYKSSLTKNIWLPKGCETKMADILFSFSQYIWQNFKWNVNKTGKRTPSITFTVVDIHELWILLYIKIETTHYWFGFHWSRINTCRSYRYYYNAAWGIKTFYLCL